MNSVQMATQAYMKNVAPNAVDRTYAEDTAFSTMSKKQYHGKNLPRVCCVILNYNDAPTVEKLVRKIYPYSIFHAILLVDNCSSDDSLTVLRSLAEELNSTCQANPPGEAQDQLYTAEYTETKCAETDNPPKITVLSAARNGGYGAGNNVGIHYAYQVLHTDYVLIANPDVEFSERLILRLLRLFERHPTIGVVSACMNDPVYGKQHNGWPLYGFWRELARCGPICRRVFRRALEYPEAYFQSKNAVYVDAVHGSMLMVDAEKMMQIGGYDEDLFLYQEEAVLGCRMKKAGWKSALLLTDSYEHRHSTSISQTYKNAWERQKLRNQSCLYYYRNYLKINRFQEWTTRLFFQIIHLEIWFCSRVLNMPL